MPQHTYYAVPIVIVTRDSKLCVAAEEDEHVSLKTNATKAFRLKSNLLVVVLLAACLKRVEIRILPLAFTNFIFLDVEYAWTKELASESFWSH